MTTVTTRYQTGTPCWFDMTVTDRRVAADFYGPVLGWSLQDNRWHYHRCLVDGKAVAAISEGEPDPQSNWTTYLATDDPAATVRAVLAAGGTVVSPPHHTPAGEMAICADPTGGVFALWRGESLVGSERVAEPGAPCWAELTSADPARAAAFFAEVFGHGLTTLAGGLDYTVLTVAGREVAGVYGGADRPNTGHGAWLVYFAVSDTDAAADAAIEHGGTVVQPPQDSPFGRMAILADPFGAHFAVITQGPVSTQS